jgi:hypothetical protein
MSQHIHGIHCMHMLGWSVRDWCSKCRHHWEEKCGRVRCRNYAAHANANLVRGVCLSIESGHLPLDIELVNIDLTDLGIQRPSLQPSAN